MIFVGTAKDEEAIRKRFLDFLLGKEVDGVSGMPASRNKPNTLPLENKETLMEIDPDLLLSGSKKGSTELSAGSRNRNTVHNRGTVPPDTVQSHVVITSGMSLESHASTTNRLQESHGEHSNATPYDTNLDRELLQDPKVLQDFFDDNSSSSEDELPRINVSGRYLKEKRPNKDTKNLVQTELDFVGSQKHGSAPHNTRDVNKCGTISISKGDGTSVSKVFCGSDGGSTSKVPYSGEDEDGGVGQCPICHTSFPVW